MEQGPEKIPNKIESQETHYGLLGKVSIMRHGDTEYTEEYPDLTERGKENIAKRGEELREKIGDEGDVLYASSPSVRAKGSIDIVRGKMDDPEEEARIMRSIRSVDIRDKEKAYEMVDEIIGPERSVPKMDKAYATEDRFENSPEIWQPRSEVEQRFFRGMEYIIRAFNKYEEKNDADKVPHLIATSHFEFLNHFIMEVFGVKPEEDELLKFAELIEMTFLKSGTEADKHDIHIVVNFRGENKEIIFNRESRSITIVQDKEK